MSSNGRTHTDASELTIDIGLYPSYGNNISHYLKWASSSGSPSLDAEGESRLEGILKSSCALTQMNFVDDTDKIDNACRQLRRVCGQFTCAKTSAGSQQTVGVNVMSFDEWKDIDSEEIPSNILGEDKLPSRRMAG